MIAEPISYEQFGVNFVRRVLHRTRVLESVGRVLGERIELGPTRRGTLLQRIAGLDDELRRFLVRVIEKELAKPHVRRATRIDMEQLIDHAWPVIAAGFLPNSPEDRAS